MEADLHCLETFVILADCGSFSETAINQGISQPAVSQRIAKLESVTGLRLFRRSQESLAPTREGHELLAIARRIMGEHQRLGIRMGRHVRETKGVVRVMVDRSFSGAGIAAALRGAGSCGSGVAIEIVHPGQCNPWVQALEECQVDLVVSGCFHPQPEQMPALRRVELRREHGTTIAWNRVYFDFNPAALNSKEVLRCTLLVPSERLIPGYLTSIERCCLESLNSLPPDLVSFDDEEAARDACLAGIGVLVFPGEADVRMQIGQAGLGIVKASEFLLPDAYSYSLYSRVEEENPKVLATAAKIGEAYQLSLAPSLV
ncbi:LysR family transcriptional regulator [Haloferula sp. BvORR071]|uniref:LysR family transcriptional regulator n=1 Tax=Haloferula sp. BvORR071 TaxID=1396141 RepID=UPI00054D762C|nr:LysR family transcriptional regulator [Haloferula sp. BvORR071]